MASSKKKYLRLSALAAAILLVAFGGFGVWAATADLGQHR